MAALTVTAAAAHLTAAGFPVTASQVRRRIRSKQLAVAARPGQMGHGYRVDNRALEQLKRVLSGLTVPAVAARLHVSETLVYRCINTGELPAEWDGKRYRVQPGDADTLPAKLTGRAA